MPYKIPKTTDKQIKFTRHFKERLMERIGLNACKDTINKMRVDISKYINETKNFVGFFTYK
jgi:hypothetical protein